jgi:hypothetical protein
VETKLRDKTESPIVKDLKEFSMFDNIVDQELDNTDRRHIEENNFSMDYQIHTTPPKSKKSGKSSKESSGKKPMYSTSYYQEETPKITP